MSDLTMVIVPREPVGWGRVSLRTGKLTGKVYSSEEVAKSATCTPSAERCGYIALYAQAHEQAYE